MKPVQRCKEFSPTETLSHFCATMGGPGAAGNSPGPDPHPLQEATDMSDVIPSLARDAREPYEPGTNVTTFTLPACWEDMEYLGLDPLTGEPSEAVT